MKKIAMSLMTISAVVALSVGATGAYFSDTETSTGNTFTAGTLDLNVDGHDANVVKFNVTNMRPGNQPTGAWTLKNIGSVNGYLDIENVSVTSQENGCIEPETQAGDITCGTPGVGEGELQQVVNTRLYIDVDKNGSYSTGDIMFYNGKTGDMPGNFELNRAINAGDDIVIRAVNDWWNTVDDNKAQGDSMAFNITFELGQTTGQ